MSRYSGVIGFAYNKEIYPGEWEDVVEEHKYMGDYYKISRRKQNQESTIDKVQIQNMISVVCDPFAKNHLDDMKYISFLGKRRVITNASVSTPRIEIDIGGVYNGPLPGEKTETS